MGQSNTQVETKRRRRARALVDALEARRLLVGTPELLLDIDSSTMNSSPQWFTSAGATSYFFANRPDIGVELFKTDGTAAGTSLLKNIAPGDEHALDVNSFPGSIPEFTFIGSTCYFVANDGFGRHLWRTDGTTNGTQPVYQPFEQNIPLNPSNLTNVNGTLFFTAQDSSGFTRLFKSSGTPATTVAIEDRDDPRFFYWEPVAATWSYAGVAPTAPMAAVGSKVYFQAYSPDTGTELWVSDGTSNGTQLVADLSPEMQSSRIAQLAGINGVAYFALAPDLGGANQYYLWRTDGTAANTTALNLLTDPNLRFTTLGGRLYLSAAPAAGFESPMLRSTDGTDAPTVVGEYFATRVESPKELIVHNSALYLGGTAYSGGSLLGTGLLKITGPTAAATFIQSAAVGYYDAPLRITGAGNRLYYAITDPLDSSRPDLWTVDLTTNVKTKVGNLGLYIPIGPQPYLAPLSNGKVVFAGWDATTGNEIWASNGTVATTTRLADINTQNTSSSPFNAVRFKNKVYFTASDPTSGLELWMTDGTTAGTQRVIDLVPGRVGGYPLELVAAGNNLFFSAFTPTTGREVWATDGTAAGTRIIKDTQPGTGSLYPEEIVALNNKAYFLMTGSGAGGRTQLWTSDGTPAGTVMVSEVPQSSSSYRSLIVANGSLYFVTFSNSVTTLWRADTTGGTTKLGDFSSEMYYLEGAAAGGKFYFRGATAASGQELWVTDGTAAGTRIVRDLNPGSGDGSPFFMTDYKGSMYFSGYDGTSGFFRTDGTSAGTVRIDPVGGSAAVSQPFVFKDKLFFTARAPGSGDEEWISDGTWAGSAPIFPSGTGSGAGYYSTGVANDSLFWTGRNGKLYQSDGTAAGTSTAPGTYTASGVPVGVGNYVIFNADMLSKGAEPARALSPDTLAPTVVGSQFDVRARQAVEVRFSEDVTISTAGVSVARINGATVPASQYRIDYSAVSRTMTVTFIGGLLADGNYRITLTAATATDLAAKTMAASYSFDFFVLAGDANRDRHVDEADQAILNANLNQTNRTFDLGDFNYDGTVNSADTAILNANFHVWLPTFGALALPATTGADAYALQVTGGFVNAFRDGAAQATYRIPLTAISAISLDALGGSDALTALGVAGADTITINPTSFVINGTTITFSNVEALGFNGAGGGDALSLTGTSNVAVTGFQKLTTLSIASTAKLDLKDYDLVVTTTPRATIQNYIRTAYNFGSWNGATGIFSSTAKNNPTGNTTLGLLSGQEFNDNNGGLFSGIAISNSDVVVKYTYFGDVDFNGSVDVSDYNLIDFGFSNHLTGWAFGDADSSGGATDVSDYNLIDFAFATQGSAL